MYHRAMGYDHACTLCEEWYLKNCACISSFSRILSKGNYLHDKRMFISNEVFALTWYHASWKLHSHDCSFIMYFFPDVNECMIGSFDCSHNCHNVIGSYICGCDCGYIIDTDGQTCNGLWYIHSLGNMYSWFWRHVSLHTYRHRRMQWWCTQLWTHL